MDNPITLRKLFELYDHKHYGEACDQLSHAITCATLAQEKHYSEPLIVAAFLHDLGHFIADHYQVYGLNKFGHPKHDELGAKYLEDLGFDNKVVMPIRLHVAAKRYQATTHPKTLSPASQRTLQQQGGAMTHSECQSFETSPWYKSALCLRELDDAGKPDNCTNLDRDYWLDRVNTYWNTLTQNRT